MTRTMAMALLLGFAATSASAVPAGGGRSGGATARAGGRGWAGAYGGGHAVPRGSVGRPPGAGAAYRHPRAGTGSGYYYGRGYGHGRYPYYGYGYGYGYRYPFYPYYGYGYGYGWPYYGLGLSFYYGGGGGYGAPYYSMGYAAPNYGYAGSGYAGSGYAGSGYGSPGYAPPAEGGYAGEDPYAGADQQAPDAVGELQLSVQPDDASVYVDDAFFGMARQIGRLRLAPGRHRIEVVRPGFRTAQREVDVQPGTAASLQIELERP